MFWPFLCLGTLAAGPASAEDERPSNASPSPAASASTLTASGARTSGRPTSRTAANYGWFETVGRVGLSYAFSDHVSVSAGVAGVFTLNDDPFGVSDDGTALVESAKLAVTDLFTPGLDLTIGRQDLKIGDGFLIQDGYADHKGAVWSIPLTFWDAARVDYRRGDFAGTVLAAKLSSSFGYDGQLYGLDFAWTPAPKKAATEAGAEAERRPEQRRRRRRRRTSASPASRGGTRARPTTTPASSLSAGRCRSAP